MKIRNRLTFQFALIVATILLLFSLAVYFFSSNFRKQDFYVRLYEHAYSASKILIQTKQLNADVQQMLDSSIFISLINERIAIYDSANALMYSSSDSISSSISQSFLNKVRKEKELEFTSWEDEAIGISFMVNGSNYVVVASAFDKYGYSKLHFLGVILIILFFTSMIIIVLSGWFFSGQALYPISRVVREVDNISASNLDAKVNEGNGTDEIALLAITFNKMLSRLKSSFELQKNFVSNASHELRTPLTVLSGQIGVALLQERSTKEYQELLRSLADDIRNMSTLVNRLLELASVSRGTSELNFSDVRIDEVLMNASSELVKRNPDYKATVQYEDFELKDVRFIVKGGEQLLKSAFINLMDNGCKFSPKKQVDVLVSVSDKYFKIIFKDEGIGIPENEMKKIFEPLYRSHGAREFKGYGLGLVLAQRIIHAHGGSLHIDSEENKGTTIEVLLPRKYASG